ncbi:MAG: signal peptidase I [Candidatus Sungbacteria bacterium]|nr:signal peptidase I [Candidatus Sungbacteria bacterium]
MEEREDEVSKAPHPGSRQSAIGYELWDIIKVLLISLAIVLPIRYFLVQPFIVRGASMEPTFEDSEYLIVDEISYYLRRPERGEVVVFRYPRDPSQFFIKRIVGLPGEEVDIKSGRVMILNAEHPSGFVMGEPYLDPPNRPTYPDVQRKLGIDEYFVLGDNRDFSSDSRIWGVLPRKLITGRTLLRVWPPNRFGSVVTAN